MMNVLVVMNTKVKKMLLKQLRKNLKGLGRSVGKERPRFNLVTKRTYTPNKTRDYEKLIKWLYQSKVKHYFEGYIKMTLRCYYSIAKSNSKKVK
ncbi:RusA family crossover junction endodeoxyribonuclease, partial [Clostridioides difficile]|uniref:RusA family crossover junction endodeoxyribonuclease n=1 Tax=Clostridioides difficile TaxID=1496 RepID=UPI002A5AFFD9